MNLLLTHGRWATAVLALAVVVVTGCKKSEPVEGATPPGIAPAAESAPAADGAGAAPAAVPGAGAEVGGVAALRALVQGAADPYVRNNAKAAADSWDRGAYVDAAVFLKTMLTLPQARPHAAAINSALAGMLAELESASAKGNASAKEALDQLRGQ